MTLEVPFDAFVTLFVFLIGIPAVVLQTLPAETRQVVTKRGGQILVDAFVPVSIALVILVGGVMVARLQWVDRDAIWTVILGAILLIGVVTALHVLRKYGRREAVVAYLEREAGRNVEHTGRLKEEALHNLIEFGKHSEPGRCREWVLEALRALVERSCRHPGYTGDRLEDLVAGVVEIVLSGSDGPSPQNLSTATAILRQVMVALDAPRDESFKQADALHAIWAMSRLGRVAMRVEDERSALRSVQALGLTGRRHPSTSVAASQVLFEIGVVAIEHDELLIAISALGHLTNLVEQSAPASGEVVADTVGLLAHFWVDGATGRSFAHERLTRLEGFLKQDLPPALHATIEHCAHRTLFRTADKVRRVCEELAFRV